MKSPSQSCSLDPVPAWLLKLCVGELLSITPAIVSISMDSGRVPPVFKCVHIQSLLKKPTLYPDILKTYRPISNLSFISKALEKVVDTRFERHLVDTGLHATRSSQFTIDFTPTRRHFWRYKAISSSLLIKCCVTVWVMLGLSAAFDTLDHGVALRMYSESREQLSKG